MTRRASLLHAALIVAALSAPVAAEPALDADAAGGRAAIELQIEAIGRGDFEEAFAYASPDIRRRFMTAANFAEMVRNGYPMVHRATRHSFGRIARDGAGLRQPVVLTDAAGRMWVADYHMALVDGVTLRPAPRAGV